MKRNKCCTLIKCFMVGQWILLIPQLMGIYLNWPGFNFAWTGMSLVCTLFGIIIYANHKRIHRI